MGDASERGRMSGTQRSRCRPRHCTNAVVITPRQQAEARVPMMRGCAACPERSDLFLFHDFNSAICV